MSKQIQRRRGSSAEHTTFTGAMGEITIDTTKNTVVVHNGTQAGGYPLAHEKKKLTILQRDAILTWVEGDEIYNLETHRPEFYDGINWISL